MIVDTSAILAILLDEPDAAALAEALSKARRRRISAPNWLEACLVVDNKGVPEASARLDALRAELRIEVVPFDAAHAAIARDAHRRFGRGNHPAKLNFGDCMAYALSARSNEPLLFKGDDFPHTDIAPALA